MASNQDQHAPSPAPETSMIKLPDPREDTHTGRVRKTFAMLDMRTAFTSRQDLLDAQQQLLAHRTAQCSRDPRRGGCACRLCLAWSATAQLDSKYLEPELQQAMRKQDGQPVRVVTYNKGM
uniref:Uncharacterized protein n=1 Tax=Peronospora matthiolae TaxID=2874970 RepID=A0AAV1TMX0_9STRA